MKHFALALVGTIVVAIFAQHAGAYECQLFWSQYYYHTPDFTGVVAGQNGANTLYVGAIDTGASFVAGSIESTPAGFRYVSNNQGTFETTAKLRIRYLMRIHSYTNFAWVSSSSGQTVANAVNLNVNSANPNVYIGRFNDSNGDINLGTVYAADGVLVYADKNNQRRTTTNYEVFTCTSTQAPKDTYKPWTPLFYNNVLKKSPCANKWAPYNNDNAPAGNGIAAGNFSCRNPSFVGRANLNGVLKPGRVQINAGFYGIQGDKEVLVPSGSSYLVDNSAYTYAWENYNGEVPDNYVGASDEPNNFYPIIRTKQNNRVRIGYYSELSGVFADEDGNKEQISQFQVLTCKAVPSNPCVSEWRKFNSANTPLDGYHISPTNIVGRVQTRCYSSCEYNVGRLQISPASEAGLFYLNDLTGETDFNNNAAEYLVKNPSNVYGTVASSDGAEVANGVRIVKDSSRSFYVGFVEINGVTYVGEVFPGIGLVFADSNNRKRVSSTYNVLTCAAK